MAKLYEWILLVIVLGATFAQIMMTSDEIMKAYYTVNHQRRNVLAVLETDCCRLWDNTIPLDEVSEVKSRCMPISFKKCEFAKKAFDEPMYIQVMRQVVFAHIPYSKIGRIPF